MREKVCCLLFCFFAWMTIAHAAPPFPGGEITAPFGEIGHGKNAHVHMGVDVGTNSGTPIAAPYSGYVNHGAGGGYIYWVEITRDDGMYMFFADCAPETLSIPDGYYAEGQIIGYTGGDAYDGPLGYSTGPHCHVEVGPNGEFGGRVDPVPILISLGVDLTGDVVGPGGQAGGGYGRTGHDNIAMPWGIEHMHQLGESINSILVYLVDVIGKGFQALQYAALGLLFVLCVIDLALPILVAGLEFSLVAIVQKTIKYGLLYVFVVHWQMLVNEFFLGLVTSVSGTFVQDPTIIENNISQPQLILQKVIYFMTPALNKIASFGAMDFSTHLHVILPTLLITWLTIFFFFVLSVFIMIVYVEFYVAALFAVFTLPFQAFGFTKFISEGVLGSLVSNTLKLCIVSVMVGFCILLIKDATIPENIFGATLPGQTVQGGGMEINGPAEYVAMARAAAQKWGVPENLFLAQIQLESSWDPNAVSSVGAQGIAQFMPDTAAGWGIDPFNPEEALDAAAHYMHNLYEQFGDWDYALAGYNGGPNSISAGEPLPGWAQEYVNLVHGQVVGSYKARPTITTEQMVNHMLLCLGLLALGILIFILPKTFMKALGGRYES